MRLLGDGNGLFRFATRPQIFAVPVVDNGLGGFKFDGPLEVSFQFFPVPVVQADMRERSVSLSKPVIQLQGLSGGQFGPLKGFLGGDHAAASQHQDRKSTRLNSRHMSISYAVFCLIKKKRVQLSRESPIQEANIQVDS